ncbi:MAG: hypothetical protein CVT87_00285 [Alphaproteobacteria bacterium HGW-Alphaproteobacteria-9]|nr:MAG: hypothetical protein CVT87_00285 [Alphaproteobacteria bacterium HGW-Alphaproteobacteria-9]
MFRALGYAVAFAFMLFVAIIGFVIVWLAWGNNSCGWEDGIFDCPVTHVAWDVIGWTIAFLGLLAARNFAREALQKMGRTRKS